ncbi:hypothetical protein X738_28145 [Mesorhizobium sp. LNHC209A00]|nr:hypothetical protein X738_28145 [Mesorhizobium sp. LNHC209A00]
MQSFIPFTKFDLAEGLIEIELARAIRVSLAHQRARMFALLSDLADLRVDLIDSAAIRAHMRAGATQP